MTVRRLASLTECLHALVYFAPEPQQAYSELGLRGYWRGYFASRAASLGTPSAQLVTSRFGGFAPPMVARAVPEVWTIASPRDILTARQSGAAAALRRMGIDETDPGVVRAAAAVAAAVRWLDLEGRPMAVAQAALAEPDDAVARLWWGCTVLREHRGDAHLAVLATYDLAWPRPHLLLAATGRLDPRQREYRGWSEEEWNAAEADLRARGLMSRQLSQALVEEIDQRTDALFGDAASAADLNALEAALQPLAARVSPGLPFPNAMGLPPLMDRQARGDSDLRG